MSPSSQMRADVKGYSSDSGWMEQNSVKTAPQPPSAFMPRKWACAPGRSAPGPAQCDVCQKRLRILLGPILSGSNNTSCFGSLAIWLSCAREAHPRAVEQFDMTFAGKVVLVTGSTTGIGEACAQLFAESGAKVMVSGRHEQRGRAVVEAIRARGGHAQFAAVDLRAAGACERVVGDTIQRLGGLDIL